MKKKIMGSVAKKVSVTLGAALFIIFAVITVISAKKTYDTAFDDQIKEIELNDLYITSEIESYLKVVTSTTKSVTELVENEMQLPASQRSREKLSNELIALGRANPDIFCIGVYFEPNGFDGNDYKYKNTPYGMPSGRFALGTEPDDKGNIIVTLSKTLDDPKNNSWYTEPFASDEPLFLEPYYDMVAD